MNNTLQFEDRKSFRKWLKANNAQPNGIWIRFSKVANTSNTLKPAEALEEALCFGWIDGKIRKTDKEEYTKYFAKRSEKSKWSDLNKTTADKLIKEGKMEKPGLAAIENAKKNGCWETSSRKKAAEEDVKRFRDVIRKNSVLLAEYDRLAPSRRKQYAGFYFEAKQKDTRKTRLEKIEKAVMGKNKGILY